VLGQREKESYKSTLNLKKRGERGRTRTTRPSEEGGRVIRGKSWKTKRKEVG